MSAREIAKAQLRVDEGLRLKAYLCTNKKWTLGYGRNLISKGIKPELAKLMTCTKPTAEVWLDEDVTDAIRDCEKFPAFKSLNEVRQAVIINMVFNMGYARVAGFVDMWSAIARGDFVTASAEMMQSKWAFDVGDGVGKSLDRAERLSLKMLNGV